MRILWLTNTPSGYIKERVGYNGGGWISALENQIKRIDYVELGVAFCYEDVTFKRKIDGVVYYPISGINPLNKVSQFLSLFKDEKDSDDKLLNACLRIIDDFSPDLIEIFGTEKPFGLISSLTDIPVAVHIQGILNPCSVAFLPPGMSKNDYLFKDLNPFKIYNRWINFAFRNKLIREKEIFENTKYFLGRTDWDRRISRLLSPKSKYFNGGEILRDIFYNEPSRSLPSKLTVISVISEPYYKGLDLILKTAALLKQKCGNNFEWNVYGNVRPKLIEKITDCKCLELNVNLKGIAGVEEIRNSLLNATVFVHPSYIDNSPNSVCESQMTSVPVIACNVGGVSSLIDDKETGFLVPSNDPFQTCYLILFLFKNKQFNIDMGERARRIALQRHDPKTITDELLVIYNTILNK